MKIKPKSLKPPRTSGTKPTVPSAKIKDQPVTRESLYLVRDELKSDIKSLDHRMESFEQRMEALDQRMAAFEQRMEAFEHRMEAFEHRMEAFEHRMIAFEHSMVALEERLEAKFEKLYAAINRVVGLVEEQRSDNRIVLEGHQLLWQKMHWLESQVIPKS